jgi:hypothetical protein
VNHGLHQTTDALPIPSLKPLKAWELYLAAFYLTIPINQPPIPSFHGHSLANVLLNRVISHF